jgi:retron-type reverse transcriptase
MPDILTGLADAMVMSPLDLLKLIRSAPRRYKEYEIDKRTPGQKRTIAQPAREVKALQYWVLSNFLNQFPVHPAATGYREGKSIADNARPHANNRFLLKLDFKDFFPSIRDSDLRRFLATNAPQVKNHEAEILARVLFWKPKGTQKLCLAIGAPSSPLLSNVLLHGFDQEVGAFCDRLGVAYTRYADDLSFSANSSSLLADVERMVNALCGVTKSPRLTVNQSKTVRVSKKKSRRVTGLVLTNGGQVSLGREQKRRIRASVHHFLSGRLTEDQASSLRGMLAYVNSVEPGFLDRLRLRYGVMNIRRIQALE